MSPSVKFARIYSNQHICMGLVKKLELSNLHLNYRTLVQLQSNLNYEIIEEVVKDADCKRSFACKFGMKAIRKCNVITYTLHILPYTLSSTTHLSSLRLW